MRATLAALLLLAPAPLAAAPSFDCAKAEGAVQELVCADADLAALDVALAARYAAALEAAGGLDAGAAEAVATLKATQRGWIKGRDDCWKESDLRACVEEAYTRRDSLLAAQWMLGEAGEPAFWICDGDAEVVTVSVAAPRPALRIEFGDRTEPAALVRSASGARYEGEFGVSFWEKGGEATLDWPPDATGLACRLR